MWLSIVRRGWDDLHRRGKIKRTLERNHWPGRARLLSSLIRPARGLGLDGSLAFPGLGCGPSGGARPAIPCFPLEAVRGSLGAVNVWDRLSYFVVVLLVMAALACVFFWYLPLFQTNTQLRKQIYSLDLQIQAQERMNRHLRESIDAVQRDPRRIERLARERLSFARTNETVFHFEAPRPK